MNKEKAISLIRQIYQNINDKKLEDIDQYFDCNSFISHSKDRTDVIEVNSMGFDKWKSILKKERMGFPDLEYLIEEIFFDSPKLIVRGKKKGTNTGNVGKLKFNSKPFYILCGSKSGF
jgi:predicted ester cyclase